VEQKLLYTSIVGSGVFRILVWGAIISIGALPPSFLLFPLLPPLPSFTSLRSRPLSTAREFGGAL